MEGTDLMGKKRINGEGHIRRRADGRWEIQLTISNGTHNKRKSIYGKTQEEARRKYESFKEGLKNGTFLEPNNLTLKEWLDRWLQDYMAGHVAPITFESYQYVIKQHNVPALGMIKLKKLYTADIQRFYSEKSNGGRIDGKEGGLSPRTIEIIHNVLRQALEQAVNENLIPKNPSIYTKKPPKSKNHQNPLSTEQARDFLLSIKDDWTYPIFLTALYTGMRRSEILGLEWRDIDFNKKTITIRRSVIEVKGKVTPQNSTKNNSSNRKIFMSDELANELRNLRKKRAKHIENHNNRDYNSSRTNLVFEWPDGRMIRPSYVSHHFKKLLKLNGLPDVRFHDLRHTFATILLEKGINPKVVSEMLGHSSIRVTMDIYSHVSIEMQSRASKEIENALKFDIEEKKVDADILQFQV